MIIYTGKRSFEISLSSKLTEIYERFFLQNAIWRAHRYFKKNLSIICAYIYIHASRPLEGNEQGGEERGYLIYIRSLSRPRAQLSPRRRIRGIVLFGSLLVALTGTVNALLFACACLCVHGIYIASISTANIKCLYTSRSESAVFYPVEPRISILFCAVNDIAY